MLSIVAVVLLQTLMRPLSSRDQVGDVCGAQNSHVPACTQFIGNELGAACSKTDDEWKIKATARVTALVYVMNHKYTSHEFQHIGDIKADVARLVSELEKVRYKQEGDCEADALHAANSFRDRMNGFAAASTARRH